MKYWESSLTSSVQRVSPGAIVPLAHKAGRWIVDAHCGDGRRFIVESDELLTAFLELESPLL